jgi:type I restriction enzyme S subunit
MGRISVAVPSIPEQAEALVRIEEESAPLTTAIARLEREIELLREYRTRLMADVVTGKLDVRPAAGHLPAEPVADAPASDPQELTEPEPEETE